MNVQPGLTLSGGEPLRRPVFALEFVRRLRSAGVSVAMETALSVEREALEPFIGEIDLFYADQKLADGKEHLWLLGRERDLVRSNLEYFYNSGSKVTIRIPPIAGFIADMENLRALGKFIGFRSTCAAGGTSQFRSSGGKQIPHTWKEVAGCCRGRKAL